MSRAGQAAGSHRFRLLYITIISYITTKNNSISIQLYAYSDKITIVKKALGEISLKKIVLCGGGTAGHVTPHLALIPVLQSEGWEVSYIGGKAGIEKDLIEKLGTVKYYGVSGGKLRRYFSWKNFTDPFKVLAGVFQAAWRIRKIKPDVLFSKGGFVSVPVVIGAWLNRVPIVCHESDMTPGLANKITMPFAKTVCCTFEETTKLINKGVYTGTPIRPELLKGDKKRGLERFGFKESKPVLMVTGGSSGAQAINAAVRQCLPKLTKSFQVLHLCGNGNLMAAYEGTENYRQVEYLNEELADAFACSDILISRAGANTLCEILALRKPALLIPYPKGASRGDQLVNAQSFLDNGYSHRLLQEDMTADTLYDAVTKLYGERGTLYHNMSTSHAADGLKNVLEQIRKAAK